MKQIPVAKPFLTNKELTNLKSVIKSNWISQGKFVSQFEERFARYICVKYAVAVSSCTAALHLALRAIGIKDGDEVIVPAFTFIATANAVLYQNAKPVFVDIDINTFNINTKLIEEAITSRTKAIIPVHLFGLPADMDSIMKVANKHSLYVIEDAACAQGSKYKGKFIGSLGNLTCFSFHPRKIITTGEGGMITTNDAKLIKKLKILRSHGASVSDIDRHKSRKVIFSRFYDLGYNYRMTDLQAAIGLGQMTKVHKILEKRKRIFEVYNKHLRDIKALNLPFIPEDVGHGYQSYILRVNDSSPVSRNEIMDLLRKKGIQTRRGTCAVPFEPYYKKIYGYKTVFFPSTFEAEKNTLALPIYPTMTKKEQLYVIDNLRNIFKKFI